MANIENAFFCAGNQARDDHPFDDQMWKVREDKAIFYCARLALVGIADYIFHWIRLLTNQIPFQAGRKAGAAHAAEFRFFKRGDDAVPIQRLHQSSRYGVFFSGGGWSSVRIGFTND